MTDPLPIDEIDYPSEESKELILLSKTEDALILVVDDEPINIEILCMRLAAKGYDYTDKAANGAEALDLVETRLESGRPMYRLILLDFSMP